MAMAMAIRDRHLPPLVLRHAQITLAISPSRSDRAHEGVREILNSLLMTFCGPLDGVVLAVEKPSMRSPAAPLLHYLPLFRVEVEADFLLFAPQPGHKVEGVVNHIGADTIGLLVLGAFNASIVEEQLRGGEAGGWEYKAGEGVWKRRRGQGGQIGVGSKVVFTVVRMNSERHIDGSLRESGTGLRGEKGVEEPSAVGDVDEKGGLVVSESKGKDVEPAPAGAKATSNGTKLENNKEGVKASGQRDGEETGKKQKDMEGKPAKQKGTTRAIKAVLKREKKISVRDLLSMLQSQGIVVSNAKLDKKLASMENVRVKGDKLRWKG